MNSKTGLRLKFNAMLIPIVASGLAVILWADYRHELSTLMEAHALHSTAIGSVDAIGPLDLAMLPEVVAARSFRAHLAIGGVILALLVAAVNLALTVFVLHPIGVMHQRIDGMEHGRWRGDVRPTSGDEVGTLDAAFQRLGPELDALMAHALQTERLAAVALVSKRIAAQIEPEVGVIARVAAAVVEHDSTGAARLAQAAANILGSVRQLDRLFLPAAGRGSRHRPERRLDGAA